MAEKNSFSTEQLQDWLRQKLGEEMAVPSKSVNLDTPFSEMNLDSLSTVSVAYDLEAYTGLVIDPTVFSEFDTPNKLVQWMQSQMA